MEDVSGVFPNDPNLDPPSLLSATATASPPTSIRTTSKKMSTNNPRKSPPKPKSSSTTQPPTPSEARKSCKEAKFPNRYPFTWNNYAEDCNSRYRAGILRLSDTDSAVKKVSRNGFIAKYVRGWYIKGDKEVDPWSLARLKEIERRILELESVRPGPGRLILGISKGGKGEGLDLIDGRVNNFEI